jgi:hypothetical protein
MKSFLSPSMPNHSPPITDELLVLEDNTGASKEWIISEKDGQAFIQIFISPIDAFTGSIHVLESPSVVRIVPLRSVDNLFHKGLRPCLHLAWKARQGRLLLNADGRLLPVTHDLILKPGEPNITPSQTDLLTFELVREMAGLYAWKDAVHEFALWAPNQRDQAIRKAAEGMKAGIMDDGAEEYDQLAVYDPEFMQWHFVPVAELTQHLNALASQLEKRLPLPARIAAWWRRARN